MGYLSPNFFIGTIKIGSIEGASCFNMGNNWPTNFTSLKKQNQGFGSIIGDNNDIHDILSRLDDADVVDMFNPDSLDEIPDWIKSLLQPETSEGHSEVNGKNQNDENQNGEKKNN